MERLIVEIADSLKPEVDPFRDRLREALLLGVRELRVQEALHLYREGVVSFARAARLGGVSREELIRAARAAGIRPRWSEEMVMEELV